MNIVRHGADRPTERRAARRPPMRCERCRDDGPVERLVVDGYPGHLCRDCYRRWERFLRGQD